MEYKPSEAKPNAYELVQHWDDKKWIPVAVQTIVPVSMLEKDPQYKLAKDVLCGGRSVVLFSNHSYHFGEFASVADNRNLETNGRVNSKCKRYILRFISNNEEIIEISWKKFSLVIHGSTAKFRKGHSNAYGN